MTESQGNSNSEPEGEIAPKLFVSYCWTSAKHEAWVLNLATELREDGVDVIFDKWDLREGNDAVVFMEQMVTDPDIQKVIMVCDRDYAEKADGRTGGVGTEAQIISPKIYGEVEQSKFVAVIAEMSEDGEPYLPAYFTSRIYIDLSDEDLYATNYEQLLRWVYDKPVYIKPKVGKKPVYLADDNSVSLGASAKFRRAYDAIRNHKPYASGALDEYLNTVAENLEEFRITKDPSKQLDDQILENIESFIPYRNELAEIFSTIAQYSDNEETRQKIHRFLERLIPYLDRPEGVTSWSDIDFDNFRFIVQEVFICLIATLLKYERFDFVGYLTGQQYYVERDPYGGDSNMVSFTVFRHHLQSLEHRNNRLKLNRSSLHADLLEQRAKHSTLSFKHVMQGDFALFIRGCLDAIRSGESQRWWPETLVYAERHHGPFEVFARAASTGYFEKLKAAFAIDAKSDLEAITDAIRDQSLRAPKWGWHRLTVGHYMNLEDLMSRP